MTKHPLHAAADRLGFMAYLFVMGGGRPVEYRFADTIDEGVAPNAPARWNPFEDSVPHEFKRQGDKVASH